jgi:hypothetical protein
VSQLNSFTFNSNRVFLRQAAPMMLLIMWTLVGLAVIDVAINFMFAYPQDPKFMNPSRLQLYFEYGRSAEGQLSRMTRQDRSETAPITLTGWYDPLQIQEPSKPGIPIVTFYGGSHTIRLANALGRISDRFSPRAAGAPGATLNWAYGAYLRDRGGGRSRVALLGFDAFNFAMISSFSPMIWSTDFPMPYTGDRFYLDGDHLRTINPPYASFDQYVKAFYNPTQWSAALEFFAKNDPLYHSFVVRENILDHSSLWRLFHRAYGQKLTRELQRSVLDRSGFRSDSDEVRVAQAILHEFAIQARSDGMVPVIFIVDNYGYSDHLSRALRPILDADHIPYLSSHTIVSPDDPRGFLPDGHFTDENDDRLATALVDVIKNGR